MSSSKNLVQEHRQKGLNGYMTLEGAMVFPAVFALVIMLLYATFFLYDKCRMTEDLYTAAYRQSIDRSGKADGGKIDISGYFMLNSCEAGVSGGSTVRASAPDLGDQSHDGGEEDGSAAVLQEIPAARRNCPDGAFGAGRAMTRAFIPQDLYRTAEDFVIASEHSAPT